MRSLIVALAASGAVTAATAQTAERKREITMCDYRLETLAHAIDTASAAFKDLDATAVEERALTTPPEFYVRAYLVFSERRDAIAPEIEILLDAATRDPQWRRYYHASYLFAEGAHEYAVLMDDSLAVDFLEEVGPGGTIWAFVRVVRMVVGRTPHFIPLLENFGTSDQTGEWAEILRACRSH